MSKSKHEANKASNPNMIPEGFPESLAWPVRYGVYETFETLRHGYCGKFHPSEDHSFGGYFNSWNPIEIAQHPAPGGSATSFTGWEDHEAAMDSFIARHSRPRSAVCTPNDLRRRYVAAPLPWRALMLSRLQWQESQAERENKSVKPVWHAEDWWVSNYTVWKDHFLAVSEKDATLLAYVQNNEKGQRGIRTQIKPGRYLKQFFSHILTEGQINRLAQWQETGIRTGGYMDVKAHPIHFARTPDEIEHVYTEGPNSCMSSASNRYGTRGQHPARVYGAGDLAVAYFKNEHDAIVARCLVWPDRKVMGRVYPEPNAYPDNHPGACLQNRLRAEGYESIYDNRAAFNGAKLLKILISGNQYVMPYIDVIYRAAAHPEDDNFFIIYENGTIQAESTSGVTFYDAEKKSGDAPCCDSCEEQVEDDEELHEVFTEVNSRGHGMAAQMWCECCRDNRAFWCAGAQTYIAYDAESIEIDGELYNRRYVERNGQYCRFTESWGFNQSLVPVYHVHWSDRPLLTGGYFSGRRHPLAAMNRASSRDCFESVASSGDYDIFWCDITEQYWTTDSVIECAVTGEHFPCVFEAAHPDYWDIRRDVTEDQINDYFAEIVFSTWPSPQTELALAAE